MTLGFDIRPGDREILLPAFMLLATITAGHAILETARDIPFLTRLSPRVLPWAYIGIAVLSLGIALLTRAPRRSGGRRRRLMIMLALPGWPPRPSGCGPIGARGDPGQAGSDPEILARSSLAVVRSARRPARAPSIRSYAGTGTR